MPYSVSPNSNTAPDFCESFEVLNQLQTKRLKLQSKLSQVLLKMQVYAFAVPTHRSQLLCDNSDILLSPADETPQVVPTDSAADSTEPAASTSQPTDTDTETGADLRQETSSENIVAATVGFQAVEQSAAIQQPTRDGLQQRRVLHVCLGPLPDAHAACQAFYFLRDKPGKLTLEDMEPQIECGVLSEGPSLRMLQQVSYPILSVTLIHQRMKI